MSDILGTVRASAWPTLFDCSLRWSFSQIDGLRLPLSGPAKIGSALHKGSAVFDFARMFDGKGSIDAATGALVDELVRDASVVEWDRDVPLRTAERISTGLLAKYCTTIAPHRNYSAVELKCEALDVHTEFGTIRLTGSTDRLRVDADGREGVSDMKSGKTAVTGITEGKPRAVTSPHHLQGGVYVLMAEQEAKRKLDAPFEVIGMHTGSDRQHVAVGHVADVKTPLLGNGEQPGLIHIAAGMLKSGIFPPNPRSIMCSKRWCAGWSRCPYHE